MTRVAILEMPDGGVAVMNPVRSAQIASGLKEDAFLDMLQARKIITHPDRVPRGIVDDSTFPDHGGAAMRYELDEETEIVSQVAYTDQRRCFRNSWKWGGLSVIEDPTKMAGIKKAKARIVRDRLLELSDQDEMRLLAGGGQDLVNIRTYRTSLRGLGTDIDLDPDNVPWPNKP